jgi:hypothetical protein
MGKWGPVVVLGPAVIAELHERLIALAQEAQVVEGRKMRVDTTVVEANIHYPTNSSLLGDGVRVLTRTMQQVTAIVGAVGTRLRDRRHSVKRRLMAIGRIARTQGAPRTERLCRAYQQLFTTSSRVVGQAKRFAEEIRTGVKRSLDGDGPTAESVVELIGHTRTDTGLRVKAKLGKCRDRTGVAVSRAEMKQLALHRNTVHGHWNYELRPRTS